MLISAEGCFVILRGGGGGAGPVPGSGVGGPGPPESTPGVPERPQRHPKIPGDPRKGPKDPPRVPPRAPQGLRATQTTPTGGPGEGDVHKILIVAVFRVVLVCNRFRRDLTCPLCASQIGRESII